MPPNRSRVTNAQGKQKSCSECAKSKRKCGLEQPSCTRCRKQNLICAYPYQLHRVEDVSNYASLYTQVSGIGTDFVEGVPAPMPLDLDTPQSSITTHTDVIDFDFTNSFKSWASLSAMLVGSHDQENHVLGPTPKPPLTRTESPVPAHLSSFAKSRIEYTIDQLRYVPRLMVETSSTPWTHCMLYEEQMPRPLQDAQAACALFVAKSEQNIEHISRFITSRADELVNSEMPDSPIEVLARAHALLLYHIIFVFGGELRFHGYAQSIKTQLQAVAHPLFDIASLQTDPVAPLPMYPASAAQLAWRSYLIRESVRRTVLSLFHIMAISSLLHGTIQPCSHDLILGNKVTISAHLWNAKSAFEFAIAWNSSKHFVVKELDFAEVLENAEPDDLDLFSKMMLVGLQGIDNVRGWFYTKGAAP